ncbi:MAG TPA: hypothetical protein VIL36_11505 [Acidimicrobiales bacterium]
MLVAVLPFACSCSDDEDDPPTPRSPESEVKEAYLEFWDMATRLAQAPDPDDPEISERAAGKALDDLVTGLTSLRDSRRHSELGPGYAHDVLSVELTNDSAAVVEDCAVDDSRIVDDQTGEALLEGVGTQLLRTQMVLTDGQWVVEAIEQIEAWEGAVPCE